ncbi:transposase [bacterium]|nr:transposase [bacterium]
MAQKAISLTFCTRSAIVNSPDSEMKAIFLEGFELLETCPEILVRIQNDIDEIAKQKKRIRQADSSWYLSKTMMIPGFDHDESVFKDLILQNGRPRKMDAESTFFMMLVRGLLDSVTSKTSVDRIIDSKLIHGYYKSRAMSIPAATTVHEYLQAVTNQTRGYIFEQGLKKIQTDGFDMMTSLTIDSFSMAANSKWPTDSRIMLGLLKRACTLGSHLRKMNLPGFTDGYFSEWLGRLKQLDFQIALTAGKPHSKGKIKKYYRQFLKTVDKILTRLINQYTSCLPMWNHFELPPSKQMKMNEVIDQIESDIHSAIHVYTYTEDRVFNNVILPSPEKVLSLSDTAAAFIKKGGRDPVIGYKPQVCRTGEGFVSAFEVQSGNPADSSRLKPVVNLHIEHTGIEPKIISVDDGYSCKTIRQELCWNEKVTVSISGSKGKKITPEYLWESDTYRDARRNRSSVESLIFTLRSKFDLWRFSRRGIDAVKSELTEKMIVHNLWRVTYLKSKQKLAA